MSKTNAARILDALGISYTLHNYEVDESDLSGITVANKIAAEPDAVFKTLVAEGDKTGISVFCIPVTTELNLKKAAAVSGNKKIDLIRVKDLFPLTGYQRGGTSPLGMKKQFPVYIDESCLIFEFIYASAGVRGTQMRLRPADLQFAAKAILTDLL